MSSPERNGIKKRPRPAVKNAVLARAEKGSWKTGVAAGVYLP